MSDMNLTNDPENVSRKTSIGQFRTSTEQPRPPLPACLFTKVQKLHKRPPTDVCPGWGLVLRGTTSELEGSRRVYTCHIEKVSDHGEAQAAGFKPGDQIASIDGYQVNNFDHADVVKIFQLRDSATLVVLPTQFKECQQVRVTKSSASVLPYIWTLMHHLRSLEIINVKLSAINFSLGSLINLRGLSVCHCSLTSLAALTGLDKLQRLESLSLAHNYLGDDAFFQCQLMYLKNLVKLDLSRNLLSSLPDVVCQLTRLQVLVVVDNNLTDVPNKLSNLTSLHTLCLDGNLLTDVDQLTRMMFSIQNLTFSNNSLECEPEVIKNCQLSVAGTEDNPFTRSNSSMMGTRREPSLRRTLSVRGQVLRQNRKHQDYKDDTHFQ